MAGGADFGIDVLMAGDAGVRPDVKIFQIAHSGGDAVCVRVIRPGVGADPIFSRAVAAFARDAFGDGGAVAELFGGNRRERRMADGAARALGGIADFQNLRQPLRARGFQRCVRPRVMKIMR